MAGKQSCTFFSRACTHRDANERSWLAGWLAGWLLLLVLLLLLLLKFYFSPCFSRFSVALACSLWQPVRRDSALQLSRLRAHARAHATELTAVLSVPERSHVRHGSPTNGLANYTFPAMR